MLTNASTKRRLGALAAACLLGLALPTSPALAQKTKTKPAPVTEASPSAPATVSVDIPTIDAVDANIDDATLRAIFSGDLVDNAEALAGLTATSITIPQITLNSAITVDGETVESAVIFEDIVFDSIVEGVAQTITMSGIDLTTSEANGEFGAISASQFDIAALLRLYGMIDDAGQTEMTTVYTDFSFDGGSFATPEFACTLGAASAAEFRARPINASFAQIMGLSDALEAQGDAPSPELLGQALRIYVDILTAFESSPVEFEGFDCAGTDDDDTAFAFSVAGMTMGGMSPGIYPSVDITGVDLQIGEDGAISIGALSFKPIDLSAPIAAIQAAPDAIEESWFAENARALIPGFAGFSVGDLAIDIPDTDTPDARLVATIEGFDLTLADYFNGIPTTLNASASHFVLDIPADTSDEQLQTLLGLGLVSIDAGFVVDAEWDQSASTIAVNEVSVSGADLATITVAGTVNNATEALFGSSESVMTAAAMGLALGDLRLQISDTGLTEIILAIAAAEQGADPATMRPVFAGLAEGAVIGLLAGAAEAQDVAKAVSAFIGGAASTLTLDLTANQLPGIGLFDVMAAQENPAALLSKVTIEASN